MQEPINSENLDETITKIYLRQGGRSKLFRGTGAKAYLLITHKKNILLKVPTTGGILAKINKYIWSKNIYPEKCIGRFEWNH